MHSPDDRGATNGAARGTARHGVVLGDATDLDHAMCWSILVVCGCVLAAASVAAGRDPLRYHRRPVRRDGTTRISHPWLRCQLMVSKHGDNIPD